MTIELPEGYYLDNFFTMLGFAEQRYRDLLKRPEKAFLRQFRHLSRDAQRLYVRLICRVGPHFRSDKLSYDEISNIPRATAELAGAGFLIINGDLSVEEMLDLLILPEIKDLVNRQPGQCKLTKRSDLVEWIVQNVAAEPVKEHVLSRFSILSPSRTDIVSIYRLLFFGNVHQDLTEFVLLDLGLYRYEEYPLDKSQRLFKRRKFLDTTIDLIQKRERLVELLEASDDKALLRLSKQLPDSLGMLSCIRMRGRLLNEIGRYYERQQNYPAALACYEGTTLPPARERRVRVLDKTGDQKKALKLCREIGEQPIGEEELVFAESFSRRLSKKLDIPYEKEKPFTVRTDNLVVPFTEDGNPENAALRYFTQRGWTGFYGENVIWNSLFGLAFWDIIFLPVEGVFFNRYQRGPVGMFTPDFRRQRELPIQRRLAHVLKSETWPAEMLDTYDRKSGTANYLVNWKRFSLPELEWCLQRIDRRHMVRIFDRLSRDIGGNKTGFPDLILFPSEEDGGGYELVEVKGPGDTLQKNQKRWIRYFNEHGIPVRVANVAWR